jgi:hypothetical protein
VFEHAGGVINEAPVDKDVPPFGNKYQLYVPAVLEEAVNVAVDPKETVAVAGVALGAAGDGLTETV